MSGAGARLNVAPTARIHFSLVAEWSSMYRFRQDETLMHGRVVFHWQVTVLGQIKIRLVAAKKGHQLLKKKVGRVCTAFCRQPGVY